MGEPSELPVSPAEDAQPRAPSSSSRRRKRRTLIVLGVIAVALVVVIWGWSSTGKEFTDVSTLVEAASADPQQYVNRAFEIQGLVTGWSGAADLEFVLADRVDPTKTIDVTMNGTYPEGFENNKGVVVTGRLNSVSPPHLLGTGITIGCASKY